MKKVLIALTAAALLLGLALMAGCGGDDAQAMACTGCGAELAEADTKTVEGKMYCAHCAESMAKPAVDAAKEAVEGTQLATHDCDGACGMKDVAMASLKEIDGKFYCAGCAAKAAADDHGHDHPEGGGHDH